MLKAKSITHFPAALDSGQVEVMCKVLKKGNVRSSRLPNSNRENHVHGEDIEEFVGVMVLPEYHQHLVVTVVLGIDSPPASSAPPALSHFAHTHPPTASPPSAPISHAGASRP